MRSFRQMRCHIFASAFVVLCPCPAPLSFAQTGPSGGAAGTAPGSVVAANTVVLREGTEVKLRVDRELRSNSAVTGAAVSLTLDEDLRVGDVTVARAGAKAVGVVSSAKKAGMLGRAGELSIRLDFLQTGDRKIKLRGSELEKGRSKSPVGAISVISPAVGVFRRGDNTDIPAGAPLVAYVDEDTALPPAAKEEIPASPAANPNPVTAPNLAEYAALGLADGFDLALEDVNTYMVSPGGKVVAQGSVGSLSVVGGGKSIQIALQSKDILNDGGIQWLVTMDYGRIQIQFVNGTGGVRFLLTSDQKGRLKSLLNGR